MQSAGIVLSYPFMNSCWVVRGEWIWALDTVHCFLHGLCETCSQCSYL